MVEEEEGGGSGVSLLGEGDPEEGEVVAQGTQHRPRGETRRGHRYNVHVHVLTHDVYKHVYTHVHVSLCIILVCAMYSLSSRPSPLERTKIKKRRTIGKGLG